MTVADLLDALADADPNMTVTCSPGGGVLSAVTQTVNGFVILDATPSLADALRASLESARARPSTR